MPGVTIRERTQRLSRSLPTDTAVFFLAGIAEKGPNGTAVLVQSVADFERYFGPRQTYSSAWDMVDGFFQQGGNKMYFSRVFGPTPTTATVNLLDGAAAISLVVTASSPGVWGASLNIAVEAGDQAGEFKLRVTHDTDTTINDLSPSLVDTAAAVAWAETSDYIRLALGASALDPAVAAAAGLVGGTDDKENATDATWLAALNAFLLDLGPGQVAYVNRSTSTAHGQLLDHGLNFNRKALLDPTDVVSKATLLSAIATARALTNAKHGAMFGPWPRLSALAPGGGVRPVPPSCLVAGRIAANEGQGMTPNQPAAGDRGVLDAAVLLPVNFNDSDRNELNEAGFNVISSMNSVIKVYGWRTALNKTSNPLHWQFGNQRLYMAIAAKANAIAEKFVLREIDGRGLIFKDLQGQLIAMLIPYFEAGSLYGETPEDAFFVDVGGQINTPLTIADGEIRAAIELTMSPMGETVTIEIVRRQIV